MNIEKEGELFEQWWEDEGQYHRVGGNEYCKTFAWEAWQAAKVESHKQASLYQSEINHLAQANQQWREKAAKSQVAPEGFVLVPKEPTPKMIDAGNDCFCFPLDNGRFSDWELHRAYVAMIESEQELVNESE